MLHFLQNFSNNIDWPSFMAARQEEMTDKRLQDFFAAGVCKPETALKDVPFIALDFETTGLNAEIDDIVSIGIVPFSLTKISCAGAQYHLLKPRNSLKNSVLFHGITHSDVGDAPDLEKIFEDLLTLLAGTIVVAHCIDIERNFLYNALNKRLGEGVCFPMIDTMAIESQVQKKEVTFLQKLFRGPKPSIRLANTRLRYGLPLYQSHHALTDALATAELFIAQVAYHYSPELSVQTLWR